MTKRLLIAVTIFLFSCLEISASHHHKNHKKDIVKTIPEIKAGHSKDSGRPKQTTSTEDRKKTDKKNRISEKKRDGYGACIIPRGLKRPPTVESGASRDRSKDIACHHKPRIVKQPRPIEWDESNSG